MKKDWVKTYDLNENYRNCKEILNFAKSIIRLNGIDYRDNSIPMRKKRGQVIDVVCSYEALAKGIKKIGKYGDWFVLTRANSQIDEMAKELEKLKIPYTIFKKKGLSNTEINEKLKEDKVKVKVTPMALK